MKTIILPIDNRPFTYVFPQLVARVAGIEVLVPDRNLMGSLTTGANIECLSQWLSTTLQSQAVDALIVSLDTLIYGGLITSRRTTCSTTELLTRTKSLKTLRHTSNKSLPIYAQSSIMRISDNYDNTEEKEYWTRYGREIFVRAYYIRVTY